MRRTARFVTLSALALALPLLGAQQGRVVGKVTDDKGNPVEGVKVTVTTSALTTFKSELVTKKDGTWEKLLIDAVPVYHYKFEKDGYVPVDRDFKVKVGEMNAELNVTLHTPQQAVAKGEVKTVVDPFVAAYNDAVEKFQAGDLDAAVAKAEEATKLGPDKVNGWDLLLKLSMQKKDWDKVIAAGEKVLAIEPDNAVVYQYMAEAYRAKGEKAKAAEWEKKFAQANPDNPDVLYKQGVDAYNKSDWKGAEAALKKLVEAKPDHAHGQYLLGMTDVNLGKIDEMKTHLNEYLKLDPNGKDAATAKEMLAAFK